MTIPVVFNEPLSFLQRLAEDVEYSHLLDKAAHPSLAATPERIALIAAFIVSHYSSTANRASKPFNPLLGETYDLVDPDRGIALVAEQVSHHPPTAALFVQGNGWQYHLAHEIKNKFLGNTLQVWPEGTVHIKFDDGEHYVYDQAYTLVHNIIMGELWIDNVGTITIRELTNPKYMASLDFKRYAAVFSEAKKLGDISGRVYPISSTGSKGKSVRKLTGNWNSHVNVDGKSVWIANPHPEKVETAGCNMTAWAWRLNPPVLDEDHVMYLPKTDSRFRPDQRALENAEYKLASTEKDRLESDQRTRRKQEDNGNVNWNPLWFEMQFNPTTGKKEWRYRHNYFAAKENGCWPCRVPSIF